MTVSPCISICKTDPVTGFCYGCGRTNEEKKNHLLDINREHLIDKICIQEVMPPDD